MGISPVPQTPEQTTGRLTQPMTAADRSRDEVNLFLPNYCRIIETHQPLWLMGISLLLGMHCFCFPIDYLWYWRILPTGSTCLWLWWDQPHGITVVGFLLSLRKTTLVFAVEREIQGEGYGNYVFNANSSLHQEEKGISDLLSMAQQHHFLTQKNCLYCIIVDFLSISDLFWNLKAILNLQIVSPLMLRHHPCLKQTSEQCW